MDRLPERMVVLPVPPAGPLLVFLGEMGMERTVAMRANRGRERVIVGLRIVSDDLDLLLDEPVGRQTARNRGTCKNIPRCPDTCGAIRY